MVKILETQTVQEIKVEVTLRTVDGIADNEVTKALLPFLPKVEQEVTPVEEETEEDEVSVSQY